MVGMADFRRDAPEQPPGPPQVAWRPGLADDLLHELAPMLAEEGIDVENIDVPDLATLQAAMNRAVERLNMTRFTPVGRARDLAVAVLRQTVEALDAGDSEQASAVLDQVVPESSDNTVATVASCIGVTLGLLDDWPSGKHPSEPAGIGDRVLLPVGHWTGERAATDHPRARPQESRVPQPRPAHRQSWRRAGALRQRTRPHRHCPVLRRRHEQHGSSHPSPPRPLTRYAPAVQPRVATMPGIRPRRQSQPNAA